MQPLQRLASSETVRPRASFDRDHLVRITAVLKHDPSHIAYIDFPLCFGNRFGNFALQESMGRRKSLKTLARPERFELPTTWFVVAYGKFKR